MYRKPRAKWHFLIATVAPPTRPEQKTQTHLLTGILLCVIKMDFKTTDGSLQ